MTSSADELRFLAPDGTQWTVHEITDTARPWTPRSLIFVSPEGFRRVSEYPANWRGLTPEQLYALSWKR